MMKNPEDIIKIILDEAFYVHRQTGPGMLENIYKQCLAYRLLNCGLSIEVERPIPVYFDDLLMGCGYRADIVVEKLVIIEIKSIESIGELQVAQMLTYLRCMKLRYGLILNFNSPLMKGGVKRVLNGFEIQPS